VYNRPLTSGSSAAWLAHSVRDAGVVGSNPTSPISFLSTMIVKSLRDIAGFRAGDASFLKEILHPEKEPVGVGYSLAHAAVGTLRHRLASTEVYVILEGRGRMRVGDEQAEVGPGDAIIIPAGETQSIENAGPGVLAFLCIVDPAWRAADEEIL
jgi:mannose-6-phosphate isomerase-like protein (cupin superfamily)